MSFDPALVAIITRFFHKAPVARKYKGRRLLRLVYYAIVLMLAQARHDLESSCASLGLPAWKIEN